MLLESKLHIIRGLSTGFDNRLKWGIFKSQERQILKMFSLNNLVVKCWLSFSLLRENPSERPSLLMQPVNHEWHKFPPSNTSTIISKYNDIKVLKVRKSIWVFVIFRCVYMHLQHLPLWVRQSVRWKHFQISTLSVSLDTKGRVQ